MKKFAAIGFLALALAGCQTLEEQRAQINAMDDARCRELGARRGTPAYIQCRTDLDRNRAIANQPRTVIVTRQTYPVYPVYRPVPVYRPYYGPRRVFIYR
jgi:hypothetical protein